MHGIVGFHHGQSPEPADPMHAMQAAAPAQLTRVQLTHTWLPMDAGGGAEGDRGNDHDSNWLRFPYVATSRRSHAISTRARTGSQGCPMAAASEAGAQRR
eukprot:SAG25_NODE_21_length_22373_cov_13.904373_19_plen_100_part_00